MNLSSQCRAVDEVIPLSKLLARKPQNFPNSPLIFPRAGANANTLTEWAVSNYSEQSMRLAFRLVGRTALRSIGSKIISASVALSLDFANRRLRSLPRNQDGYSRTLQETSS
ncbi:MAG TPA: hypothetical protein VMM84_10480 [Pyrinomonadaceae bacterium]|nr:hypothetical protein [Pyrinomonadaceae bacterium]